MISLNIFFVSFLAVFADARVFKSDIHNLLSEDEVDKVFGTSRNEVPEYDITHPVQLNEQGDFLSRDLSHDKDQDLYVGFSAFGQDLHLKLTSNTDRLLAEDFITEIRNNGETRLDRSVDRCHYLGHVITAEGPGEKVALSNCDGLTGVIQGKKEVFMIRPLPKRLGLTKRAHVVYKRSHGDVETMGRQLGIDVRKASHVIPVEEDDDIQDDSSLSRTFYIESLVVTDSDMVTYHGSVKLLKNYILALMNIAQSLLSDSSIGADIRYVINKLEILETNEPDLLINSHAEKTLSRFCKWASKQKGSLRDSNKAYFDHAALISRKPFCANSYDPSAEDCNSLLGLADLGGMCGHDTSCTLSTDSGLGTAFTLAHETGHNLGAEHDGEGNRCPDAVNIMARKASGKPSGYKWSRCTRNYIKRFLRGSRSKCLRDAPGQFVKVPSSLAGQEYTLDDQCRLMVKGSTGFCKQPGNLAKVCSVLWCTKGDSCQTINEPAAEGSQCGKRKLCKQGRCVRMSAFGKNGPKPVDGGFSSWSSWSSCSHTCDGGIITRTRQCNNPRPKNNGKPCQGKFKQYKYCVNKKCPLGSQNPRMTQCQSKRNLLFTAGKKYDWVYNPKTQVSAKDRCKLTCEAPVSGSSSQYTIYTFGDVPDGVHCDGKGPKGVCIDGTCQFLGCDNVIRSKAKPDRCGVCNGDGSTCSVNIVSKTFRKVPDNDWDSEDYQTITTIPAGAQDIVIKELSSSMNYLALETIKNQAIVNMDYYISDFNEDFTAAGTTFKYRINNYKETIRAKGPLTEAIRVKFLVDNNGWYTKYRVFYKYTMTPSKSGDAPHQDSSDQYKWVTSAQGCSATCGGGKRILTVQCVRVDDGTPVSRGRCDDEEPKGLEGECNTQMCPARWSVGEWGDCTKTCNDGSSLGHQTRQVMCVFTSNGEEELLFDSACKELKPTTVQTCGNVECPAAWVTVKTSPCSATCGTGTIKISSICQKTDTKGQQRQVAGNLCPSDDKPPSVMSCNTHVLCK